MAKTNKPSWSGEKSRRTIDVKASAKATLAATTLVNLALIFWTAAQKNDNYNWPNPFWHNLTEMAEWKKQLDWNKPIPLISWEMIITADGKPYEINDMIELPYDCDMKFDGNTNVIDSTWLKVMENILVNALSKKDTSAIVWFNDLKKDVVPNVYIRQAEIDSVKWYASPEAIKYDGVSTAIWHIEAENLKLAKLRADKWKEILKNATSIVVSKNPYLSKRIDLNSIKVSWEEIQFTKREESILETLRKATWYATIEQMISANEHGKIKNKVVSDAIKKIVNTKRKVVVTFKIKGVKDTIYVVPLLILPILIFKKKDTQPPVLPKKKEKFYVRDELLPKTVTQKVAVKRKQPRDKRPNYFTNAKQWNFNRNRKWRTD